MCVDVPVTTFFWSGHDIIVDIFDGAAECCLNSRTKSIVFAFYDDDSDKVADSVVHTARQCMRVE